MATLTECLLHPIDCARAAEESGARAEAARRAHAATLPPDDPYRVATERRQAQSPSLAARLGFDIGDTADSIEGTAMWTAIAVGAAVIGVIVIMLTIVHFTNRI